MEAIRRMEPAWEKVQGLKFELSSRIYNLPNGGTKVVPLHCSTRCSSHYLLSQERMNLFHSSSSTKRTCALFNIKRRSSLQGITQVNLVLLLLRASFCQFVNLSNRQIGKAEWGSHQILKSEKSGENLEVPKKHCIFATEIFYNLKQ